MLKRLQSLELPMTHINHGWPLYTAYECMVMMILPLHHYLTYSCGTNMQSPRCHINRALLSSPLPFRFSHSLYFLHYLVSSHLPSSLLSTLLSPAPTLRARTETFILSCSHSLSGPRRPWAGQCQPESGWLKEKGYTHYTD